jgi:signal transduction histidine kinase
LDKNFPSEVETDKDRLTQVMLNLLCNANKFSTNGKIEVSISLNSTKDLISIQVKDKGIGIKDQDKSKLFQPLEKLVYG